MVRLCKPHPCGIYKWEVVRVGACIALKCPECQQAVSQAGQTWERRAEEFVCRST